MTTTMNIRYGWIKFMYIYTIIGAGGFGLGMIVFPNVMKSTTKWSVDEPIIYGIMGSVWLAIGILSVFGLISPLKFTPVLLFQLSYKSIWFICVVIPMLIAGKFPNYAIPIAVLFLTYIVGDLIALPFGYLFSRQSPPHIAPVTK